MNNLEPLQPHTRAHTGNPWESRKAINNAEATQVEEIEAINFSPNQNISLLLIESEC